MKMINRLVIIILLVFSFYYTNKMIEFLKEKDPIMKEIRNKEDRYKINPINALIEDNNIISGMKGREIDYKKSYSRMKRYGAYNETLMVLKEVEPKISTKNNYDKYIIGGNRNKRSVSLVFRVEKDMDISNYIKILDMKKISATFFIDGCFLENNVNLLKKMKNHELEILSYDNMYNESLFKTSISYLENLSGKKIKYCYSEKDNKELLNLCKNNKLHTIKPTLYIKNNLYKEIKYNISNSIIISIDINNYNEKELEAGIDYIKEKGYKIVLLDDLISE